MKCSVATTRSQSGWKDWELQVCTLNTEDLRSWLRGSHTSDKAGAAQSFGSGKCPPHTLHRSLQSPEQAQHGVYWQYLQTSSSQWARGGLAFHLQGHVATDLNQKGYSQGWEGTERAPLSFQPGVPRLPLVTYPNGEHTNSGNSLLHTCLLTLEDSLSEINPVSPTVPSFSL